MTRNEKILLKALKSALAKVSEATRNESIDIDVIPDKELQKWENAIKKAEKIE